MSDSSKSSSSSYTSVSTSSTRSSRSSVSSSTLMGSTSSQTNSTSSSRSSLSSLSSSSSSEIKARELEFAFRGTKWSSSKLICSAIPSIKNSHVSNKQCQIIRIPFATYTIKYISLFLGKILTNSPSLPLSSSSFLSSESSSSDYNLVLEVYNTDAEGLPQDLLATSIVSSGIVDVGKPAWYSFDFGIQLENKTTPDNQLLALVFYQSGGNEMKYTQWYYSLDLNWGTKAYVSKNAGAVWTEQFGMARALIASDIFNIFEEAYIDSTLHALTFPAGQLAKQYVSGHDYLNSGEFINTKVIGDAVEIEYKPAVLSIIVDASGSMGFNDRYQDRITAIRNLITKLKAEYPDKILFDLISFGSYRIEALDFSSSASYMTIKIDLNNPTRYALNNDASIPSIADGLISFGLKDLVAEHTYIISSINLAPSKIMIEDGIGVIIPELSIYSPDNYENVGNANNFIKFSVDEVGTGSEKTPPNGKNAIVCKVPLANSNIIRKPFASFRELNTAFITEDIEIGDTEIFVDSFDDFNINSTIDIFNAEKIDVGLRIILEETIAGRNKITFDRAIVFDFKNSFDSNGSLLQESSITNALYIDTNDTMVELLIKDAEVEAGKKITFYLQTIKGGMLEWDFVPFQDWESMLLFYAGDSALLEMQAYDSDGKPLPDSTRVDLYVDEKPAIITDSQKKTFETLRSPIKTGDNSFIVYESDTATEDVYGANNGDLIILKGVIVDPVTGEDIIVTKTYEITNIEEETVVDPTDPLAEVKQKTITFSPTHLESWDATSVLVESKELDASLKLDMPISAVDITPQRAGVKLDPSLLEVQDPPQVEPSSSPNDFNFPNTINLARERKRDCTIDIPLNKGVGRIRILPITEDVVETTVTKQENAFDFYDDTSLTDTEKIEKENLTNSYLAETQKTKKELEDEISPPPEEIKITSTEWTIETPVYLESGKASSHMTAVARKMTLYDFNNYKIDFIDDSDTSLPVDKLYSDTKVLAKKHTVFPLVTIKTDKKTLMQEMPSIDVYFQEPIQLSSCVVGDQKYYCKLMRIAGEEKLVSVDVPSVYALTSDSIEINYNVFYREIFLKSGQIRIKIFDVNRNATDMLEPAEKDINLQSEANPYMPTIIDGVTIPGTPLSETKNYYHENVDDLYINNVELQEATYLPGYAEGGYTINVVNGRAILTISSDSNINFKSHLRVVAEILSPNDNKRSTIITNEIFIISPLEIVPMVNGVEVVPWYDPQYSNIWRSSVCPGEDRVLLKGDEKTTYNLGAKITWGGQPIEDNVLVEFSGQAHDRYGGTGIRPKKEVDYSSETPEIVTSGSSGTLIGSWPATKIAPGVSKTINGVAQDAYVGVHGVVVPHYIKLQETEAIMGDQENITIKTSFNGVKCNFVIKAMWMGEEGEEGLPVLYASTLLYKNGSVADDNSLWADGWEHLLLLVDLSVSYVGNYPGIKETAPFLLGDVKVGNEMSKPTVVKFGDFGNGIFTKSKPVDPVTNQPLSLLVTETTNIPYGWAVSPPVRKSFIPVSPESPAIPPACQECYPQACSKVVVTAPLPQNVKTYGHMTGCWSNIFNDCPCVNEEGDPTGNWHKPIIIWKDPLQGSMSLMSAESPYILNTIIMDGINKTRVDVDVSFSGKAIPIIAKKHGVVRFKKEIIAKAKSWYTQYGSAAGPGSAAWGAVDKISMSNAQMQAYNDQMWDYYIAQIKAGSSQPTGNTALIQNQAKPTIAWTDYFPTIYFEIYLGVSKTDEETGEVSYQKSRNVPALSLTASEVLLSVKYTSGAMQEAVTTTEEMVAHFHECNIDQNGNGGTYYTYKENTYDEIENHTHSITGFVVQDTIGNNVIHYHEIKSTASVYINPFTRQSLGYLSSVIQYDQYGVEMEPTTESIILHAWTEYDASRDFIERKLDLYFMVDIDAAAGIPKEKIWNLTLSVPNGNVQESTTNDYSGFSVDVNLIRKDGKLPPDGTRVQIEMNPYAIKKAQVDSDIAIETADSISPYIRIHFDAKTIINDTDIIPGQTTTQIIMSPKNGGFSTTFTQFKWLPSIKKLVPEITDDALYINQALAKIESIGCSQLNDAIVEASSRIKKYYLDNSEENASYSIITFTDGDENYSERDFKYVANTLSIGFDIPIYSVGLGNMDAIGKNLLNAYAIKTGGSFISLGANSVEQIDEQIVDIIQNQQTNRGIYSNVIELPDSLYIKEVTPLVTLVSDSNIYISFQVGNYLNNLGSWSDEFQVVSGQPIDLESLTNGTKNKYIKYKATMTGSDTFQSPLFLGCLSTYIQPRSCKVFSQPIETTAGINDVVSEITIAHKATVDDLFEIEYGICPLDSVKESNYYNDYILPFKSGERYIVLSRSNESMNSEDNITYKAQNGPWDNSLQINVYSALSNKSIYQLINSDEYVVYPEDGRISFNTPRQATEIIIFSILFPSKFRILCRVKNNSLQSAYIDHIGLTYGLATKTPGAPVSSYIEEFESSSSSSVSG